MREQNNSNNITLRKVAYDRQRIENAGIAAGLLGGIDTKKYPAFSKYLDGYKHRKRNCLTCILEYLSSSDRRSFNPDMYNKHTLGYLRDDTEFGSKAFTSIPYKQ